MPGMLNTGPGFGGQLGGALGGGISSGIQALAEHKLGQIIQRHQRLQDEKDLKAANFKPEAARFLATLSPDQRLKYIQGRPDLVNQPAPAQQLQQQAALPSDQNMLGLTDVLSSLDSRSQVNPVQKQLQQLPGASGQGFLDSLLGGNKNQQLGVAQEQNIRRPQSMPSPAVDQKIQQQPSREKSVAEILTQPALDKEAHKAQLKEIHAQRQKEFDLSREYRETIRNKHDSAHDKNNILSQFEELNKQDLAGPLKTKLFQHFGLEGLLDPNSQLHVKLESQLAQGAKEAFGSRLTEGEVRLYMRGWPSLMNTKEGRALIISQMKIANKAIGIKYDAMNKILKENGGVAPIDLRGMVEDRTKDQITKLSDEFKKHLKDYNSDESGADNEFDELPPASEYAGKKIETPDGSILTSNGTDWV